jgi:DNA-binding CsgD family transcriptional regulator
MFRLDLLRDSDVGALLRIAGESSELAHNKVARRTHVLRRLLDLIGGRSAAAMEMALPDEGPFARAGTILNIDTSCEAETLGSELYLVHNVPADPALRAFLAARGQTVTMVRDPECDRQWYRSEHYDVVRRPFDMDHSLYCRLTLPDGCDMAVGIQRCPGDPLFGEREKAIVHLLHTHAPHVYAAPTRTHEPKLDRLAPRLQPVLRYLMQGNSDKEIAMKLKLSRHTIHRYTQAIFAALGVHSRGELLAKYATWV